MILGTLILYISNGLIFFFSFLVTTFVIQWLQYQTKTNNHFREHKNGSSINK